MGHTRVPIQTRTATCAFCEESYIAFRKASRFCSSRCRWSSIRQSRLAERHAAIIATDGPGCADCGERAPSIMYLRLDPYRGRIVRLCGLDHSALSRRMFRDRVPNATQGYAKSIFRKRKIDANL